MLVRTRRGPRGKEQWLLFHKRDDARGRPAGTPRTIPQSVISGRTNDEVTAQPDAMWTSDGEHRPALASIDFVAEPMPSSPRSTRSARRATGSSTASRLHLTNLDKPLFPGRTKRDEPVTKRDLIRYYACIAPMLLPYLEARPLNLHRFPNGVDKPGFWQKQAPTYAPEWITRWRNDDADEGETEHYFVVDSPPALAWLANHAAVELHPWTSRIPDVHQPTYALIDLDPGEKTTWDEVVTLARASTAPRSSTWACGRSQGHRASAGIQIWVPIEPGPTFEDTRAWVEALSRPVGEAAPDLVSWTWEKRARGGLRPPRLHAERDQQDPRRALSACVRSRRAGVDADQRGTSSTIPTSAATAGRSATRRRACSRSATSSPACSRPRRSFRRSESNCVGELSR